MSPDISYERKVRASCVLLEDLLRNPKFSFAYPFLNEIKDYYRKYSWFTPKQMTAIQNVADSVPD